MYYDCERDFHRPGCNVSFFHKPFLHGQITDFAGRHECSRLVEFINKNVNYEAMRNDMYCFEQSNNIEPLLSMLLPEFRNQLILELPKFLTSVFGFPLISRNRVQLMSARYNPGDYLLCHNDLVGNEKDLRKVAFVFYLYAPDRGGKLNLFECNNADEPVKVVKSIIPHSDLLTFFEVSSISYHEVSENLSGLCVHKDRISIHGWFHTDVPIISSSLCLDPATRYVSATNEMTDDQFVNLINPQYIDPRIQYSACQTLLLRGDLMMKSFLTKNFYESICNYLPMLDWSNDNKFHKRNYEVADELSLLKYTATRQLVDFCKSHAMLVTLSAICETNFLSDDNNGTEKNGDLNGHTNASNETNGCVQKSRNIALEMRRIMPGSYSLLWSSLYEDGKTCSNTESSNAEDKGYIWTSMYFDVGIRHQMSGGETVFAQQGHIDEILHVEPINNAFNLVIVSDPKHVSQFLHYCRRSGLEQAQLQPNTPLFYQLIVKYKR